MFPIVFFIFIIFILFLTCVNGVSESFDGPELIIDFCDAYYFSGRKCYGLISERVWEHFHFRAYGLLSYNINEHL